MKKYGGYIELFELEEWWESIKNNTKSQFKKDYASSLLTVSEFSPENIDDPSIHYMKLPNSRHNITVTKFLSNFIVWALNNRHDNICFQTIDLFFGKSPACIDAHFLYNSLIDIAYKRRNENPEWLDHCIDWCKKDISITKDFLMDWKKNYPKDNFLPRIPSFERLAIIYEKQGKYEEALSICRRALELGLHDTTKGGFEGRINRLQNKLNK